MQRQNLWAPVKGKKCYMGPRLYRRVESSMCGDTRKGEGKCRKACGRATGDQTRERQGLKQQNQARLSCMAGSMGRGQLCEVQQLKVTGPALGSQTAPAALQAGGRGAENCSAEKDLGVVVSSS